MTNKSLIVAFGIVLSTSVINANAQTTYTEGTISYTTSMNGMEVQLQEYFTPDSIATQFIAGPTTLRTLADAQYKSFAIMIDVPIASIKKAAIFTPDEIVQSLSSYPALSFAPTSETKQISGFNCKKVLATDPKTQTNYDLWITNDVTVPAYAMPTYYKTAGGFPVQYTVFNKRADGNLVASAVTVNSVTNQKAPDGIFSIPDDYDRISKSDMEAMSKGRQ